ncbi:MAG: hypothetical protein QX203_03690 [Methylococcaceae bacterium]
MNTIPFDTLHFTNQLKSAGFTDDQARVIIELQLATYQYIRQEMDALKKGEPWQ